MNNLDTSLAFIFAKLQQGLTVRKLTIDGEPHEGYYYFNGEFPIVYFKVNADLSITTNREQL